MTETPGVNWDKRQWRIWNSEIEIIQCHWQSTEKIELKKKLVTDSKNEKDFMRKKKREWYKKFNA